MMMHTHWYDIDRNRLIIHVRVIPQAAVDRIDGIVGTALKVRIQAPPADGRANDRLIRFLSAQWKIPRQSMDLVSGRTSRSKRIRINNPPETLLRTLAAMDRP